MAFAFASVQTAEAKKIAADLNVNSTASTVDVIVQFNGAADQKAIDKVLKVGAKLKKKYSMQRFAAFSLPPGQLKKLEADPAVRYISPDRRVRPSLEFATPAIGANLANQYGWTGQNVGVAVIDSGISDGADFKESGTSRLIYSESLVPGDSSTDDAFGHGTHVAGIIAGNASNSKTMDSFRRFQGVAPAAKLINLRVLDGNGAARDSDVITAIERAIALKDTYNIRVINMSLGRPVFESWTSDPLCQAVQSAWSAGIVVVTSAGNHGRLNTSNNHGYGTITSPGNSPYVITVGAMSDAQSPWRGDDRITTYSSKGPSGIDHVLKPDLVAPGNRIISVKATGSKLSTDYAENNVATSYYRWNPGSTPSAYMKLSGTSMAAPMVAGAVALLLQKTPSLTPDTVKARLMKTATKAFPGPTVVTDATTGTVYTSYHNVLTVGAGYIDIVAALNSTDIVPLGKNAQSPSLVPNYATQQFQLSNR